jgi:hypothetical protein
MRASLFIDPVGMSSMVVYGFPALQTALIKPNFL